MKAFTNTPITKERFIYHLKEHQKMDAFVNGTYGENSGKEFKGCAVGCSINSINLELNKELSVSAHVLYEEYLGVPEWLARLEDTIFEGVPEERQKTFPIEFGQAINEGSDLDKVKPLFLVYVLESCLENVQNPEFKEQKEAVEQCIELWKRDDIGSMDFLSAADSAHSAARSAAHSAADSADYAYSAAYSAYSAAYSAYSARSAADSAHSAARSAYSTYPAKFNQFADKLLGLIKECK